MKTNAVPRIVNGAGPLQPQSLRPNVTNGVPTTPQMDAYVKLMNDQLAYMFLKPAVNDETSSLLRAFQRVCQGLVASVGSPLAAQTELYRAIIRQSTNNLSANGSPEAKKIAKDVIDFSEDMEYAKEAYDSMSGYGIAYPWYLTSSTLLGFGGLVDGRGRTHAYDQKTAQGVTYYVEK